MRREEVFLATKLPKSRLATLGQGEETIHALHTKPHERNAKGFLELCFVPFRVASWTISACVPISCGLI